MSSHSSHSQTLQLTVKAHTENLSVVRSALEEFALTCGATKKNVFDLQLAVDEAFTNIIKHAYSYDENQDVIILMRQEEHKLIVSLTDKGKSFNIDTYQKPNVKSRIKLKKRGGVGVFLMTQLMDEVTYDKQNGSNIITMAKLLA